MSEIRDAVYEVYIFRKIHNSRGMDSAPERNLEDPPPPGIVNMASMVVIIRFKATYDKHVLPTYTSFSLAIKTKKHMKMVS